MVLRQKNRKLEQQLQDLVEVARSNDSLATRMHALSLLLLTTASQAEVVQVLEEQLRISFNADCSVLVLFASDDHPRPEGRCLRIAHREDASMAPFRTFFEGDTPRCGQVRDSQRDYLFGDGNVEIGSVALIPLGRQSEFGFLTIGSRNSSHFHPGMSIDFLSRLGELLSRVLGARAISRA